MNSKMEADKLTIEQKVNLKMARSYLVKVNFQANVHSDYYETLEKAIEYIENLLQ